MNKAWKFVGGMSLEGFDRLFGDGSVVVLVAGKTGGVHLSHVEVFP